MRALWLLCLVSTACVAQNVERCETMRRHGDRSFTACYQSLARSGDAATRAEGLWGLEQYDAANEAFRAAVAQPGSGAAMRVRWGMLLEGRFNHADAVGLFQEAIKLDPHNAAAYVSLARVSADGFDGRAAEYAAKAVDLDPKSVAAHEVMASIQLDDGDMAGASTEADAALALAPDPLDAMAIHAAVELVSDRSPEAWFAKIRAVNPGYGRGYALVAHALELHYRYDDAIANYRKAIEADPRLWSARSQLGINLMRMGQEMEPRTQLTLCYENGYRDAATVNSLRLLDSYKNFATYKDDATVLRLNKSEDDLLRPYFEAELHRAIATYENKYKMKLTGPVQLEVYPDHEDFAVRTMGMPGLGALGVTFGQVVAMDSPSARKPGDFNWDATLWHELSHVFILTATEHRVPRWFTEGLAVHEEGQASPEWSNRLTPEVLVAIRDRKLLPVDRIDRGFVMPEYPAQVVVSYFQAGAICDYIQSRWGEEKLLAMVHAYAARKSTSEVIRGELALSPEEFDAQFLAWLDARYGTTAAHFEEWRRRLKALVALARAGTPEGIVAEGEAARALYPEYVAAGNAYGILADAHAAKGDKKAAAADLSAYKAMGGEDPSLLKKLAAWHEELGDTGAAAAALDRINAIYPVHDAPLHQHLGELWLAQANYAGAIREFGAVVALHPLDMAGAEFDLARAYFAAGQKAKAEENVLLALEAAPGFRPAQKLLLELEHPETKP